MHLVDRHRRRRQRVGAAALGHPLGVPPRVAVEIADDRGGARRRLEGERVRVGLERRAGRRRSADLELVERALADAGDEELPDPVPRCGASGAPAVPAVEVADHADPPRVGRPDREAVRRPRRPARGWAPSFRSSGSACPRRAGGGRDREGRREAIGSRPRRASGGIGYVSRCDAVGASFARAIRASQSRRVQRAASGGAATAEADHLDTSAPGKKARITRAPVSLPGGPEGREGITVLAW